MLKILGPMPIENSITPTPFFFARRWKQTNNINAANKFAVSRFLDHKLSYPGIIEAIEASLDHVDFVPNPNVDKILETEAAVYEFLQSTLA